MADASSPPLPAKTAKTAKQSKKQSKKQKRVLEEQFKDQFYAREGMDGRDVGKSESSQLLHQPIAVIHDGKQTTWQLEGDGAGRVVLVKLAPQSNFSMQRGAMICMSSTVTLSINYSLRNTYRRFLSGESIIHTTAEALSKAGEVRLAGTGDVNLFNLQPDCKLMILPTHYLASSPGVQLKLAGLQKMGFWKRVRSNTGLFYLIATGQGVIALEAHGQLQSRRITPADGVGAFVVDNEHIVAWTTGLTVTPQLAVQSNDGTQKKTVRRAMSSMMSGEGIVMAFSGTGTVFFQTRLDRIPPLESRMTRLERMATATSG